MISLVHTLTFLGSMLNFFLPMAICLFLWVVLLQEKEKKKNRNLHQVTADGASGPRAAVFVQEVSLQTIVTWRDSARVI